MTPATYLQARDIMVKNQLKRRDITNKRILKAFASVPRHEFVPPTHRSAAYSDNPIPIGYSQTISQPYVVAHMIQEAGLKAGEKVLDIGTGSGYAAAIMSRIAGKVYSIERIEALANRAEHTLQALGFDNVWIRCDDGYKGWEEHAPYDAIILGAAPSRIPDTLKNQLRLRGRLVAPVGEVNQQIIICIKESDGFHERSGTLVRFVPMKRGKLSIEESD